MTPYNYPARYTRLRAQNTKTSQPPTAFAQQ